ncbi:hypothetical protein HWI79_537 [Cryptosporidium felis]|nr:hypothetical protein HWI79_537 [Cryptosporidium felis]
MMEDKHIQSKIRKLTKDIEDNQDILSDPQKRSEYGKYVNKDEELSKDVKKEDYQSFFLLCEFGSIKALINEKRYNKMQKQSQNSIMRSILSNWKQKYANRTQDGNIDEDNASCSDGFSRINWNAWFNDFWKINIFPINNIKFNTLQGLMNTGSDNEPQAKKVRVVNSRPKNSSLNETRILQDKGVHDSQTIRILEGFKENVLKKIQDCGESGIELWDLVLDSNEENGFSNTCFKLFSLLALLKDSKISIYSQKTVINDEDQNVIVSIGGSTTSGDAEKNTGIISRFTYTTWIRLCEKKANK